MATGLRDEERDEISAKLKNNLIPGEGGKPPASYRLTGGRRERPHYWVRDAHKSVVLKVFSACHAMVHSSFDRQLPYQLARRFDSGLQSVCQALPSCTEGHGCCC